MNNKLLLLVFILGIITSCKKYPDGPDISFVSKAERFANTWKIDVYFENGVNKTSDAQSLLKDYTLITSKDGNYSLSYKILSIIPVSETGTWAFNSDKTHIIFTRTSPTPTVTTDWKILKLMEEDLWGEYTDSSKTIKVQLKPY